MKQIGIIGFGFIGKSLFSCIENKDAAGLQTAFVHNRSKDKLAGVPALLMLERLEDFAARKPDLIVECTPRHR